MELKKEDTKVFFLWVDWNGRVISFHEAKGFEKLEYPTHEEMFAFAIDKGSAGFGIQ